MSLEFDVACLRAPCDPSDCIGVEQLIGRAKLAAEQLERLAAQRDELLNALKIALAVLEEDSPDEAACEIGRGVISKIEASS